MIRAYGSIPCEQSPLVFLLGTARRSERDSATAYFPEEDLISSFRFRSKPVIKPVSNLKLRIIIQVFGLLAPQRIYTSSAESLSLLRAVPRRNTRGLCSQGTFIAIEHQFHHLGTE
jgi:hypothetical protein